MSIKPLPEDVVRRIRSSAAIVSLDGVVCGLVKNSFDAGATRINVTVDYSRGNCTVEDDGQGILPLEFREAGGLCKLYYTSRHSPEDETHGANGNFLASLAALSLLSITSHHHLHNSQNSLTVHNSRVLARNLPALPEQQLNTFAHGTRVIVRDLFGSMAVRVKQRALASEKAAVDKEWGRLVHDVTALLLAWPSPVALVVRDTLHKSETRFRPNTWFRPTTKPDFLGRSSLILAQSSLVDGLEHASWIPVGASLGKMTIEGCVSLNPVATRRAQFISLGIQPVANEHGSNVLYTEVNNVFVKSGFAIDEGANALSDGDATLPTTTGKITRPKRGLDRWPMFYFRISSSDDRSTSTTSFEDLLEDRGRTLPDMIELLKLDFNIKLSGRISKAALTEAEVVAQVDRKFVLVKLARETDVKNKRQRLKDLSVLVLIDQHAADERCRLEALMQDYFEAQEGSDNVVARIERLDKSLQFEFSAKERSLLRIYSHHFRRWGIVYRVEEPETSQWRHKSKQLCKIEVVGLPPSILERCRTEPKILADLLRAEAWKLQEEGRPPVRPFNLGKGSSGQEIDWISNFHGCPQGILDLLNSRSCRSAIMFNDILSMTECEALWRAFDFFDVSQVRLADDETRQFFESNEIASVCSGSDSLFLGSYDGYVRIVGSSWKVVKSFQAHDVGTITHLRQIEGTSLLVTVAEDLSSEPVLKIWALDKLVKKTNMPTCLSTLHISNNKKQFPATMQISALDVLDNLSQVAVGFANGTVTLIRGDLINDLGARQRIVHESEEPVTGVELMTDPQGLTTLFISTTARILKLAISRRGHSSPPKTVEDLGCNVDCMTVDKKTGDVVVAREDAIYTYTLEGRGAPRAYESPKRLVSIYQDYVALICPPSSSAADKPSDTMRRRFGGGAADALFNASTFVLLEPDLRVTGHTQSLISPFKAIFQIWGDLFILTQDGKVNRYHEKSLQQRLEMLYQRNMFPLAIELAQKSGMDATQQSGIFRRFGDHLYQKADYDGAMVQYIKAIDTTEPSQVIRKFLDTQRIHNLIQYLEQLHEHRKATADHTTLLLNCYAKLKDIDKLEAFIKSPGDLKFDLETAISMCRQGGYYEQAAYLAKKHGETDLVVDILIEDSKKYDDALDFIWRQDPEVAYPCLKKYARVLIENCPKDATNIFVDYYTGKYRPRIHIVPIEDGEEAVASGGVVAGAANAVQNLSNFLPLPYMNTSSIASPSTPGTNAKAINGDTAFIMNPEDIPAPKYTPPRPRTAFSSFIDHPDEFIVFLEACLEEQTLDESDRTDIYTTLFEMYLHKSNEKKGETHREEWESKAKKLIEGQNIPMESSNVLLLSHLSDFKDGTTLVKEQSGLLFDIFRSYTSAKDTRGAIKALRKYGPEEPQLYPAALAYFTSDPRILEEAGPDELAAVLGKIDKDGLMAPLQVIQTLVGQNGSGGGGVATMGMIKPYLHETIDRERREIAANRRRISAFRTETEQKRAEMADLGGKPAVFQSTRCAACTAPLDLPAVHFLCKHSFHQRCLRAEGECPQCANDNATIRALRKTQIETAGKHELFKAELERSEDRFGTVAEWFGRGVMGAPAADTA
ncbi:vacuolar membrane protein [Colletotrichum musicola]|uniref:Vacuolar membrane protein n=1 Tax=Colletotrichum musicola TaxID=2175873 RepID=A0A8H6KP12_9PEZI|nr:vacuolar membrane protein [Colletotrichum musicola]